VNYKVVMVKLTAFLFHLSDPPTSDLPRKETPTL